MPWDKIAELAFLYGPIGAIALVLGWLAWDRDSQLRACQKARLEDAEKRSDLGREDVKALEKIVQASSTGMAALTIAVENRTAVMTDMSNTIRATGELMRGVEKALSHVDDRVEQLQDTLTPRRPS